MEDCTMTEAEAVKSEESNKIEEVAKASSVITSPLTPPTPDPQSKDKTHIKVEALPVNSCGMMDRTRVALFAFMFTFLFINPLSYIVPQLDKGEVNSLGVFLTDVIYLNFTMSLLLKDSH